jgi:hypothetical protein
MAFLMTHFYEGGTAAQYEVMLVELHPDGELPPGQVSSAAGPTDGGWMISAVWESREAFDQFRVQRLIPTLAGLTGGFTTTPQERVSELKFFQTAT